MAEPVDEKHGGREIGFLGDSVQERSRRISAVATGQRDGEDQICDGAIVVCNQDHSPSILTAVSSTAARSAVPTAGERAVRQPMYSGPNRPVRAFNASYDECRSPSSE